MSGLKMQMKIYTNQSSRQATNNQTQHTQQRIANSLQNQSALVKSIKLGFTGVQRNTTALQVNGQKFCKSCNDKK
tara:strand:- start:5048 stop:5272 length:225 start_codon:yes stop_codon:yes gene_type:complete